MLMFAIVFAVQAAAVGAAWLLRSREAQLRRQLPYLVSLAVGVLLATALLHLLPEAIEVLGNTRGIWLCVGGTLFVLFALERVVLQGLTTQLNVQGPGMSSMPDFSRRLAAVSL